MSQLQSGRVSAQGYFTPICEFELAVLRQYLVKSRVVGRFESLYRSVVELSGCCESENECLCLRRRDPSSTGLAWLPLAWLAGWLVLVLLELSHDHKND